MTMVLTAGTHDFMVQVSDRRLVNTATGGTETDDAIKAVAYCNFMAVAYTGLAELEGERTDIWIAQQLQQIRNPGPNTPPAKLRDGANAAFQTFDQRFRHAFIGMGLAPEEEEGGVLHPFQFLVSNFHDEDGEPLSRPRDTFSVEATYLTNSDYFCVSAVGQPLEPDERSTLTRTIRRGLARGLGQQGMMRLLAARIREVAERVSSVGKDLLATCYPAEAVDQDAVLPSVVIKGAPRDDNVSFHDLRHGTAPSTLYQPHIVGPGFRLSDSSLDLPVTTVSGRN